VAIIGILHLNKNTVLDTIYRVMGSMGWVAAARAVWLIMKDKDYDVTNLRFFTPVKTNLSFEPISLAFSITDSQRIVFEAGIYNIDIEEQLSRKKTSPIKKALEFLQKQFKCVEAEAISVNDIAEKVEKEGVKESTLQKAKGMLGIESERREGRWYWRLPSKKEYEE